MSRQSLKNSIIIAAAVIATSCTMREYDVGDGTYSYYTADMVTFTVGKDSAASSGIMDNDKTIQLTKKINLRSLINNNDATQGKYVRTMFHYNKQNPDEQQSDTVKADPIGVERILLPKIVLADTLKEKPKTDPLTLNSSWMSANGKFLNIQFSVKTSTTDEQTPQTIGLVCDSITRRNINNEERSIVHLRMTHDQKDIPQYYSVKGFLCISREYLQTLCGGINPTLQLTINTYDGDKTITAF
ncbi:MAG: hypothetical protein HUK08_01555 [Bacteroidaceae bacterium]|nr:hypothetical protein [Bacteroidaceae bacterium]